MVHELVGIQDNKVDLGNIGKFSKDQQVIINIPSIYHHRKDCLYFIDYNQ